MTEAEWMASENVKQMVAFLHGKASDRKFRLFLVACCERVEDLLVDGRSRSALACARRAADGRADAIELDREHERARAAWGSAVRAVGNRRFGAGAFAQMSRTMSTGPGIVDQVAASDSLACATQSVQAATAPQDTLQDQTAWGAVSAARAISLATDGGDDQAVDEIGNQCSLLRDIFGNPFRPVAFDPAWRTPTAVALARQMYESRDFSVIPILADALQDAGCDNEDVLDHCRGPGPHARGCWVVDLVLGKQ